MYKAGVNIEFASAEYSLKVGYEKSWVEGHETIQTRKYIFEIEAGEIFWLCQKIFSIQTLLGNDEIEIQSEEIKRNGPC